MSKRNNIIKIISMALTICIVISVIARQNFSNTLVEAAPTVFSQTDSRWGSHQYGYSNTAGTTPATISSGGCGILAYVNAVYYMTGNFIEPITLADWSVNNGYRVNGVGTSFGLYSAYASSYGSQYGFKYSGTSSSISGTKSHLQNGGVAIISVPGHLMALVDYDSSTGKYLILDSYRSSNRGTYPSGYRWLTASEFTGKVAVSAIMLLSPTSKPICNCSTSYAGNYTVNTSSLSLNMRSGHGTSYGIVTTIPKDATVYVSKSDGTWAHVEYNGYSGYCTMEYLKSQGSNPVGSFDNATGKLGCVNVYGWAFDSDNTQANLQMHVYIGGEAGSGAPCYVINANKNRPDVDAVYGTGANHGFAEDIYTYKTGTQEIYVYAINVGGGTNALIGHKTVEIAADTQKPKITDIRVIEKDSQGYTVQCKVTDNGVIDRVLFPTWTVSNGQDDLSNDWASTSKYKGVASEEIYTFRVNKSAHNEELGLYTTHIYAYDKNGNYSSTAVTATEITEGYEPQSIYKYDDKLITLYNESVTWSTLMGFSDLSGSNLLFVKSKEKQTLVETFLEKENMVRSYYYIGFYQDKKGTPWKWIDGESLGFTNWGEGQPDCAGDAEFYGSIRTTTGAWNDLPSSYSNAGFIMETPLDLEPAKEVQIDNKLYKIFDYALPYEVAERFCEETGGCLAIVSSEEENKVLTDSIQGLSMTKYYLGADDCKTEGTFLWNDDTALSYSNWDENEPNDSQVNGGQDYLVLKTDGYWDDIQKYYGTTGYIAQYEIKVTPTPTATPTPEPTATPTIKPTATPTPEPTATPTVESTATPTTEPTPTENVVDSNCILGDVNSDKKVNTKDAAMILQYIARWEISIDEEVADVNGDTKINSKDAALVLQYCAGWDVEFFQPSQLENDITCSSFTYGKSENGRDLICYSIGPEEYSETILMNFAIHGYEDEYAADGQVLVDTANKLIEYYSDNLTDRDCRLLIIPCANPDGLYDGYTNNGYGRCNAKGIDLNRDFDANYKSNSNARNYTEYAFSALESQALRDLFLAEKPGVVLDFHGWLNETIGNTALAQVFLEEMGLEQLTDFTDANCSGYFANWAYQQGALGLLVEFTNSTSINSDNLVAAINRLIEKDYLILEKEGKYKEYSNIECYSLSTENVTTYQFVDTPFSSASYIDGETDLCTLLNIYNNGWVQVKYPLYSGGYKTAYCPLDEFIENQNYKIYSFVSNEEISVYRRNDGTQEFGTIFVGDECIVVDEKENMKQVIFPITGGYKMGWIDVSTIISNQ